MMVYRLSVLALAASLSACAGPPVGLAPVAPLTPLPQWRTDNAGAGLIDPSWWQSFGDPKLTTLIDRGLVNNTDVGIAIGRVREARAQEQLIRAQLFPTLDAVVGGTASRTVNAFGKPQEQIAAQPGLQIAYELDLFGRISDQSAAARNSYLASQAARDATRLAVAATIASGYITLSALDARLALARRTLDARSEALRLAQSRRRAGYSPLLELRQAEAEYQATVQVIPQAQLALARQENALSILIGDMPRAISRTPSLTSIITPAVPGGLPSELLTRRPDIAQAEYQLAAADSSLAAARKRFLPQIRLTGSAGAALSSLLGDPVALWSLGGSVLAPIFEGGRLTAQAETAGAQRDQAAFTYRRVVLNAFREVEDNLAAADRLAEQRVAILAQRDALAGSVRFATNRFRAGYSPYLEQLDAQRALLAAELSLIQIDADILINRVTLYQAMGGGWTA